MKKHRENVDKSSVQIYINEIENRITFKIKDGYTLELLKSETMKLLGSTENKVTKDKKKKKWWNCTTSWNYRGSISSL